MKVCPDFWRGKRVLVTGHSGFKGSWLAIWLKNLGCELIGFSLPPTNSVSMFEMLSLERGMSSIMGDVRDISHLKKVIGESQPEIVIHMAAQPLVRESYSNPVDTFSTNVIGTVNVLEALRDCKATRVFINVTTDKCYENREWVWGYKETDRLGGHDPYSSSKACSELVTSSYRRSFFSDADSMAIATARAGNVIGGGDWSDDRLVPDTLAAFRKGKTVLIRNPTAVRPWQHVLEPVSGYLLLAQHLFNGDSAVRDAWNFGPFEEDIKPVSYLVSKLASGWPAEARWQVDSNPHVHEANLLKLDISKARAQLGWSPTWNLNTTLESILAWERCLDVGGDLLAETNRQIDMFINQRESQK